MKHAGAEVLESLEALLVHLRAIGDLRERLCGTFCRKSFLHFHEDPAGIFADLRTAGG
jgi:hypothetical protein